MDLKTLKLTLVDLKGKDIYDHDQISPYYRVFTSLYEKKEAIDFLISKLNTDTKDLGNKLKDKLDLVIEVYLLKILMTQLIA